MNRQFIDSVFKMISTMKYFNKVDYELSGEDITILYRYYKTYGFNKKVSWKKFQKAIVNYSIVNLKSIHTSCEEVCKKLESK